MVSTLVSSSSLWWFNKKFLHQKKTSGSHFPYFRPTCLCPLQPIPEHFAHPTSHNARVLWDESVSRDGFWNVAMAWSWKVCIWSWSWKTSISVPSEGDDGKWKSCQVGDMFVVGDGFAQVSVTCSPRTIAITSALYRLNHCSFFFVQKWHLVIPPGSHHHCRQWFFTLRKGQQWGWFIIRWYVYSNMTICIFTCCFKSQFLFFGHMMIPISRVSWAPQGSISCLESIPQGHMLMSGACWSMSLLISMYDLYHTESRSIHDILLTYYFLFHQKKIMIPATRLLFHRVGLACRQEISEEVMSRIRLAEDAWSKGPETL